MKIRCTKLVWVITTRPWQENLKSGTNAKMGISDNLRFRYLTTWTGKVPCAGDSYPPLTSKLDWYHRAIQLVQVTLVFENSRSMYLEVHFEVATDLH